MYVPRYRPIKIFIQVLAYFQVWNSYLTNKQTKDLILLIKMEK